SLRATVLLMERSWAIPLEWHTDVPVWIEQWPLTAQKLDAVQNIIQDLLKDGRIIPSRSQWNSPIFVIQKKDKSKFRMLHDLRAVNALIKDWGALQPGTPWPGAIPSEWPVIAMDISDCFFSIPLAERDSERFAFTIPSPNLREPAKRYQWTVLPQGMKNSPYICQQVVAEVIRPIRERFRDAVIIHYMDDILIAAAEERQTEVIFEAVKTTCHEKGLKINEAKTQRAPEVSYLGWRVMETGIAPLTVQLPETVTNLVQLQRLLGIIQWLKPILSLRPEQLQVFYDLLKGKTRPEEPCRLTEEAQQELRNIQQRLQASCVGRWRSDLPITLFVCTTAAGGIGLIAQQQDQRIQPLYWLSSTRLTRAWTSASRVLVLLIRQGSQICAQYWGQLPDKVMIPMTTEEWELFSSANDYAIASLVEIGPRICPAAADPIWPSLSYLRPVAPPITDTPLVGRTVFTDASSQTAMAVAVWQENGRWKKVTECSPGSSVQQLEARAVQLASDAFPTEALNVVTDSLYVARLVSRMATPGWPDLASPWLYNSLSRRTAPLFICHVQAHQSLEGLHTGNDAADRAAKGLWPLQEAVQKHAFLHLGAKALAQECNIPLTEVERLVKSCSHCQKTPLWMAGVNPRGLEPNQIWQTDFTMYPPFRPNHWLAVTVDTYSGVIVATAHRGTKSRHAIHHWTAAIAYLGRPSVIKTDNGSAFTSKAATAWAQRWHITLKHGIAYNSQGQAIVERANRTLKARLEALGEGEGWGARVPPEHQPELLYRALYSMNFFARSTEQTSVARHWSHQRLPIGPAVLVRDHLGAWQGGWHLMTVGRGYAVGQDGTVKWVPARWVKPR
nr:Reverse Transcriptase-and Integrase precursor [Lymphoproliferative disease virus]